MTPCDDSRGASCCDDSPCAVRVTAIAVGHLRMKLALFIGGFARAGEIAARLRFATDVVLLSAVAVATTAATSATASAPTTAFATRPVLRRTIARFEGRRCIVRSRQCCRRRRERLQPDGVRIGGSLLLALAFALALTLRLALGVALRVALARLIVSLTLARRGSRVASRGGCRSATVATMLATSAAARLALTIASAVLVTMPVTSVRAAITIARRGHDRHRHAGDGRGRRHGGDDCRSRSRGPSRWPSRRGSLRAGAGSAAAAARGFAGE